MVRRRRSQDGVTANAESAENLARCARLCDTADFGHREVHSQRARVAPCRVGKNGEGKQGDRYNSCGRRGRLGCERWTRSLRELSCAEREGFEAPLVILLIKCCWGMSGSEQKGPAPGKIVAERSELSQLVPARGGSFVIRVARRGSWRQVDPSHGQTPICSHEDGVSQ